MFRHKDWTIRLNAVKDLTDQSILNNMAQDDENEEVRTLAKKRIEELLDKINDPKKIVEIAKKDDGLWVRIAAVRRIKHQPTLLDIIINDKEKVVKDEAFERITDLTTLEEIALNEDIDEDIRKKATRQITNPAVLNKLYTKNMEDTDSLGDIAYQKLCEITKTTNDKKLLLDIATNNKDSSLRNFAVSNQFFENQKALISIAINDDNLDVRKSAISKITNTEVLNELIALDENKDIRAEIIKNPYYMNNRNINPLEF